MVRNSLLLRWKDGFRTRTDSSSVSTWGRREGFLSVAGIDSAKSADGAGDTALTLYAQPRRGITAAYEPASDSEIPYSGNLVPGKTLTAPDESNLATSYRCESVTVTEDDNGYLQFVPELTNPVETDRTRTQRWLSRIGQGTLNGRSSAATLLDAVSPQTSGGRIGTRDVVFSKGVLEVSTSPPLLVAKSSRLTMVQATVVPGSTNPALTFRILRNGTALSFTAPGGSALTTFSLTPSVARLVLLPSTADYVVAESDTISIDLVSVASDANLFGVTATLADLF